jgi:hypothetical protein
MKSRTASPGCSPAHNIAIEPASGRAATSDRRWGVALNSGSIINVNFGSQQTVESTAATDNANSGEALAALGLIAGTVGVVGWLAYRNRRGAPANGS